ncbi:MAG: phosphatidate cytidylyltransferase [Candidatus Omnitrophota bacterium]|jgi:phosphatidate cytidylyltransferase
MIVKRIITALSLIILVGIVIAIDWLTSPAVIFFAILALYEFFTMVEKKGIVIFKYFGLCIGLVILLSLSLRFEVTRGWELFFITLALLSLILIQFRRRQSSGVIIGLSTTIFGILYITWFMGFLIKIRYLNYGAGMLATVVWVTKVGDIGAYLLGSRFGRHALISRISPNKTREGFLGGILFSLFAALGTKFLMPASYSYAHLLILGFCLGVLGQLGDLSESLMKRDCAVKDSGNIFPGLGGALDCIDSLLFSAPVFYFWVLHFGS